MSSILKWTMFRFNSLYSDAHKDFATSLLPSLLNFSSLLNLDISFCGLRQIPDAIGCLRWLERLVLGGNNFVTLPSLIELSRLVYLDLQHCKLLESLPQLPFPIAFEHDFHKYKYWLRIGLVIFNCPKLRESECCSSMAFSWMIHLIQARQQFPAAFFDVINIVIPESEIPNWFNNPSVSGSIPIELSPFVHDSDDDIIGIACCAVFSIAPIDPAMTIYANANRYDMELSFSNKTTCNGWYELFSCIPVILERDLISVKSDHMWLTHFTRDSFFDILKRIDVTLNHLDDFCMKVVSMDVKVQSCGYRWVYKQDLQLKHGCGNFLDRKCKFLAIEDEAQPQSSSNYITP
ncbi:hypothetical protein TSUD_92960 [Trifolium subterraneum]|uniref:C-JID domain-containing protein n=1 Tax=Trifolium subterraneum TaxID=3900 RepID=A0A2Z6N6L7_TRISU|nr:hypothetical protein TSUD_92960 [Trifolium subterraneum]